MSKMRRSVSLRYPGGVGDAAADADGISSRRCEVVEKGVLRIRAETGENAAGCGKAKRGAVRMSLVMSLRDAILL